MQKIIHLLTIRTSPKTVYDAITTKEGLSSWWSTDVAIEDGSHQVINFTFIPEFNPVMRVRNNNSPTQVKWECISGHDRWLNNIFTFELKERNGKTSLKFVQEYKTEITEDQYATYNFNWGFYLQSLRNYCENGIGRPHEPSN